MTDLGLPLVLFLAFVALPALRWANAPRFVNAGLAIATIALAIAFLLGRFHIPVPAQYGQPLKIVTMLLALIGASGGVFQSLWRHSRHRKEELARNERSA